MERLVGYLEANPLSPSPPAFKTWRDGGVVKIPLWLYYNGLPQKSYFKKYYLSALKIQIKNPGSRRATQI